MKKLQRGLVKTSHGYMHYRATGSGPALVLMHQNGGSSTIYLELLEALPDSVRAIAIDFPSCGQSDHTPQLAIADYANVVAEILDALGITKASFLGAYGGAYVAAELALSRPTLVEKVILVNCPWYPDKATEVAHHQNVDTRRPQDASGWPLPLALGDIRPPQALDPPGCPGQQTQNQLDRDNVNRAQAGRDGFQLVNAFEAYELPPHLAQVEHPVMNLMGQYYRYAKYMEDIVAVPKHGTPMIIHDACSSVVQEQPEAVSREVIAFLGR